MLRLLRPARAIWRPIRMFSTDKDITYVNSNNLEESPESAAAASQFFEYQTGRWSTNDREERTKRTTKFDFKGSIQLLQNHVDVTQSGVAIETLEPSFEGKHNKSYKIVSKDQRSYVSRIPYALGSPEYRKFRSLSEAATSEYLGSVAFKDHPKFRATLPLAYSGTAENEIKTPYISTSFVNGEKLAAQWKPWELDIEAKKPVIEPMVQMAGQVSKQKFPAYGSSYFAKDSPEDVKTVKVDDQFVIGPSVEKQFWRNPKQQKSWGPWNSWSEYLQATADVQVQNAREVSGEDSPNFRAAERYAKIVPASFTEKDLDGEKASPRLFDPDFSPLNVIVQDNGEKYWLIDVENSVVKPYVSHGVPWFVRNPGERVYRLEDVPNFDASPEQQKSIVRHFYSSTQTEFTYEKMSKELVPELIFAHHPNSKRREEVVHRALQTDINSGFFNDLDYSMFKLIELWDMIREPTEKVAAPISFSEQETDESAHSIAAWNQQLMRNKYLESKGFIPAEEFDQSSGTGASKVLDDQKGHYESSDEFLDSQDSLKNMSK